MSYIPNIKDEFKKGWDGKVLVDDNGEKIRNPYFEGDFNEESKQALRDYDLAANRADTFFDNLEVYGDRLHMVFSDEEIKAKLPVIRECLSDWLDMGRNEFGTALRDNEK
jgi:hypothetical protein